ncbi:MAG: hypothetical protein N4A70_00230 [Pelagimonas sp.]|nr:hypothetical protein [Pelagimonas sp.]
MTQTASPEETALWESIKDSNDPLSLQVYLDVYPNGAYADRARQLLSPAQPIATPDYADEVLGADETFRSPPRPTHKQKLKDADLDQILDDIFNKDNTQQPPAPQVSQAEARPELCDLRTEHPMDARRKGAGIAYDDLKQNTQAAIDACLPLASNEDLDPKGKYAFQLSRAHAAAGATDERMKWLEVAIQRGWIRAYFRRALMAKDNENSTEAQLFQAVDDFIIAAEDYPSAYLMAARLLWTKLGGYKYHKDKIYDLVTKADERDTKQSHYFMALMAINGEPRLDRYDLFYHLAQTIEEDYKADWARRHIARRIGAVYDAPAGVEYLLDRAMRGEDPGGSYAHRYVNRNKRQFVAWAQDALLGPDNDKISISKSQKIAFDTMLLAMEFGMDEPSAENDALLRDNTAILCEIAARAGADPGAIRPYCVKMDSTVFALRDDLARLTSKQSDYFADIDRALSKADIQSLTDCLTDKEYSWNRRQLKFTGYNRCTIPLHVHTSTWAKDYGKDKTYNVTKRVGPSRRFTITRDINDSRLRNYDGSMSIRNTACHTRLKRSYIADHLQSGGFGCPAANIGEELLSLDSVNQFAAAAFALDHAIANKGEIPASTEGANRAGIRPEHCALIVASRKTLPEVHTYIQEFRDTQDWNWKVFKASNGWFAISSSLVEKDQASESLERLKAQGKIPSDAFCTAGNNFVERVF